MKTVFAIFVMFALAVGGFFIYRTKTTENSYHFRTAAVQRGDLLSTITATGTVEPEEVVDVGAQVAGRIESFGIDPNDPARKKTIDFGSNVHEGTILARIDDTLYVAQVRQATASLNRAKADLLQYDAKCLQAEQEWKRAESLRPKGAIADTDYDLAVANYKAAKASVEVGKATIEQNEAALKTAKTNLDYTIIKSPVEGKIIARRVNIGQTVVASLNAPSLFLIGKDLRRIQVWASVNEADIGNIHVNMPVRFTVDAFPTETFRGRVVQIRLNASMTQNVVTYTVVVATDNSEGKLLPYLTANLRFELQECHNVLLAPNAALRWKPRREQVSPKMRDTVFAASAGKGGKPESPKTDKSAEKSTEKPAKDRNDSSRLWTVVDGFVEPLPVTIGATDGSMTVIEGDLKEGQKVVIGEGEKDDADAGETTNPFAPKIFSGKKNRL